MLPSKYVYQDVSAGSDTSYGASSEPGNTDLLIPVIQAHILKPVPTNSIETLPRTQARALTKAPTSSPSSSTPAAFLLQHSIASNYLKPQYTNLHGDSNLLRRVCRQFLRRSASQAWQSPLERLYSQQLHLQYGECPCRALLHLDHLVPNALQSHASCGEHVRPAISRPNFCLRIRRTHVFRRLGWRQSCLR